MFAECANIPPSSFGMVSPQAATAGRTNVCRHHGILLHLLAAGGKGRYPAPMLAQGVPSGPAFKNRLHQGVARAEFFSPALNFGAQSARSAGISWNLICFSSFVMEPPAAVGTGGVRGERHAYISPIYQRCPTDFASLPNLHPENESNICHPNLRWRDLWI